MIQDSLVIEELDIFQSSLERLNKYRLKTGLPILEALKQVKNLTNNKIRDHKHPLLYDYEYT